MTWIFVVSLVLATVCLVMASVHRVFRDTSPRHYHKIIEGWRLADDFDDAEKLSRINVLLDFSTHLLRAAWLVTWVAYRKDTAPWYWHWLGPWDLTSGWGLATVAAEILLMSLVIIVLVPQAVSIFRGNSIAVALFPLVFRLETLFSPLTGSFRGLLRGLLRFGNSQEPSGAARAEERIRAAVEIGEWEGVLHDHEKTMIESVLEFRDAEVAEVMTPRTEMVCMDASLSIEDAVPGIIECSHSRIPVYRENIDNIIGVLYVKDLLRYNTPDVKRTTSLEKVVRKVYFVPESKKLSELLAEFRANRFHIAVILDEYGGTSGLVTIEDIIEEIVGEIEDEFDMATRSAIHKVDENTYDVDGRAHIWEVNEALARQLPESNDYDTVAGFLFSILGRVPSEGERVEYDSLSFVVTSADERKIKRVRVQLLHPQSQDSE